MNYGAGLVEGEDWRAPCVNWPPRTFALAANVGKRERDRSNQRRWRMSGVGRNTLVRDHIADVGA